MSCDPSQVCPLCDQRGLPILPVRYAVARTDDVAEHRHAPALQAPFMDPGAALPGTHASYTLRLVRGGYLYVFNERRNQWKGYVVTDDAHLVEFDIHRAPTDIEDAQPCARMVASQTGRCIMVPDVLDPSALGMVWLAFSEVAWTADVLARHADAGYRRRHMRSIDTAAWVASGGAPQPHLARFTAAVDQVAEFKLASGYSVNDADGTRRTDAVQAVIGNLPFEHAPTPMIVFDQNRLDALRATVFRAAGLHHPDAPGAPPAILALDDPAGIAVDLNQLILTRVSEWTDDPAIQEPYETALTIRSLQQAVGNGAAEELGASRRDDALAADTVGRLFMGRTMDALRGPRTLSVGGRPSEWDEGIERAAVLSEEDEVRVRARRWSRYQEMYDHQALERYLDVTHPSLVAAFEAQVVVPLDTAYREWLQSGIFRNYYICNFDPRDVASGLAYTQSLYAVLREATGRRTVCDYLRTCLDADPALDTSLELRALLLNQDEGIRVLAEAVAAAPPEHSGPYGWDAAALALYTGFKDVLENSANGPIRDPFLGIAQYVQQLSGPLLERLGQVFDAGQSAVTARVPDARLMALLGMVAKADSPNARLIDLRSMVNRTQAARILANVMSELSGVPEGRLRHGARLSLDRLADPRAGRYPYQGVLVLDEAAARSLSSLSAPRQSAARAAAISGQVLRPEQFDDAVRLSVRSLVNLDVKTNAVGALLATATPGSAWRAMQREGMTGVTFANMGSALATFAGAVTEASAAALQRTPWGASSLARPMRGNLIALRTRADALRIAGKALGVIGGVIAGVLAMREGWAERQISRPYAAIMISLGAASLLATGLVLFSFSGIGFVLAIAIVILMAVVGYFKKDDVQKWLDRALVFGHHKQGPFEALELQQRAYASLAGQGV